MALSMALITKGYERNKRLREINERWSKWKDEGSTVIGANVQVLVTEHLYLVKINERSQQLSLCRTRSRYYNKILALESILIATSKV